MSTRVLWSATLAILVGAGSASAAPAKAPAKRPPGLYAVMTTNMGAIVLKLYEKEAPETVKNFVGLASGTKTWTDPKTGKKVKKPFFNGLTFHRVIPGFMIQGGDPLGNGSGGPGYEFANEYHPTLKHDRPGRLSMANAGPDTNGSQFFITVAPYPSLDQERPRMGYSIFGQVVEGMPVAIRISEVPRNHDDKPLKPVVIQSVKIERIGTAPGKPAKKP
jgi:peptidyl-prolyl cis-trans isomerase A (cyclophilin A)